MYLFIVPKCLSTNSLVYALYKFHYCIVLYCIVLFTDQPHHPL